MEIRDRQGDRETDRQMGRDRQEMETREREVETRKTEGGRDKQRERDTRETD